MPRFFSAIKRKTNDVTIRHVREPTVSEEHRAGELAKLLQELFYVFFSNRELEFKINNSKSFRQLDV